MEEADKLIPKLFASYREISGRSYGKVEGIGCQDAESVLFLLGSSYDTSIDVIEQMRNTGKKAGAATLHVLRPFPAKEIATFLSSVKNILVADRQDSYGAGGGNLSLEVRAAIQRVGSHTKIKSLVYGLGGKDFFPQDVRTMLEWAEDDSKPDFAYYGINPGEVSESPQNELFAPITREKTMIEATKVEPVLEESKTEAEENVDTSMEDGKKADNIGKGITLKVTGGTLNAVTAMPGRIAPGHGACPGCGIPVNLNLLLRGIEDPVVFLFQTGCAMIVTTAYPKTSFKVPYLHNLFQNGAATLSGVAEICYRKQEKGEIPKGDIIFVMVSGDGGLDIGMGAALGTALRGHRLLIFEYDNGGYMNTGYQLSYSTPLGARSSTSHIGKEQYGKTFFHKDMPKIMAATGIPYVATVAESNPTDFIKKAAKAAYYAKTTGTAYVKAISACPLNWNDKPATERKVIEAAVNSCYFPLYEVEQGVTRLSYDPEKTGKKIPVIDWLSMMGRTRHLQKHEYADVVIRMQQEVDRRFMELKKRAE